jgi:hypothetical protein
MGLAVPDFERPKDDKLLMGFCRLPYILQLGRGGDGCVYLYRTVPWYHAIRRLRATVELRAERQAADKAGSPDAGPAAPVGTESGESLDPDPPSDGAESVGRVSRQPGRAEGGEIDPADLTEPERLILEAMLESGATAKEERQGQKGILERAGVDNPEPKNHSHIFAHLRDLGLIEVENAGRRGGTWLTEAGAALARELAERG